MDYIFYIQVEVVGQKPTHIIGFGNNYIEKEIKFKLKVLLVSYFNSNNLGDVLLSNILYFELKKNHEIITCSFEGCFVKPKKPGLRKGKKVYKQAGGKTEMGTLTPPHLHAILALKKGRDFL